MAGSNSPKRGSGSGSGSGSPHRSGSSTIFTNSPDGTASVISVTGATYNEKNIREHFLNFFVAVLKDYRKFLNFGSTSLFNFRSEEFINSQPSDWTPFLRMLVGTQLLYMCVYRRKIVHVVDLFSRNGYGIGSGIGIGSGVYTICRLRKSRILRRRQR